MAAAVETQVPSQVRLPEINTHSIYEGKYKDRSPNLRTVSILLVWRSVLILISGGGGGH